jgi:hypothetical protein
MPALNFLKAETKNILCLLGIIFCNKKLKTNISDGNKRIQRQAAMVCK